MSRPSPRPDWDDTMVSAHVRCVVQDNPGPMTLDGTNSWVVADAGRAVVIDPGEDDPAHLDRIVAAAAQLDATVETILLTHHHHDHQGAAPALSHRTAAPILGGSIAPFAGPMEIGVGGLTLAGFPSPGHTRDSYSFVLAEDAVLLTGDMVLGRGTTVVAHPDGQLGPYLDSLERFSALVEEAELATILPGHGPMVADLSAWLAYYRTHRMQRLDQVRAAVEAGATDAPSVVRAVYADVPQHLWPAAELSVQAQLDYLAQGG